MSDTHSTFTQAALHGQTRKANSTLKLCSVYIVKKSFKSFNGVVDMLIIILCNYIRLVIPPASAWFYFICL